jgi:DNA-binding response OmpR family regulator
VAQFVTESGIVLLSKIGSLYITAYSASTVPEILEKGALRLDILAGQAFYGDEDLLLTKKEFALLLLLAQNEGKIVSAEYLYEKAWKQPLVGDKNAVQTAVSKLRKKIEPSGYDIATERGQGYSFMKG